MTKLSQMTNGDVSSNVGSSKLPNVVLIDDDKWPHIQKWYSMTERELPIARSVCRGMSNQQIASDLKIQPGTVKTHMRNIYRKAWVNNKIAMLLRFVEAANSASSQSFDGRLPAGQQSETTTV